MKKVCVIGTGYVGLVGAAVFADWGNSVVGVDIDEKKIAKIEEGIMPIYEPGLDEVVLRNIKTGKLSFTTSLAEGMKDADMILICVGTPMSDTGAADLSYVWAVAKEIGQNLKKGDKYVVIITKSTVPVGTNERVKQIVREYAEEGVEFDVASNPEFLAEGRALEDMKETDRTVVGTENERALTVLREFYGHLDAPMVECDLRTAEMIKYASNAILATKISFINEIGQLCERAGADVGLVAKGMGYDKRIGRHFLNVSIGYGGSCFPKDVAALYKTSTEEAYDFKLLRSVMEVNDSQMHHFVRKIRKVFGINMEGKKIACLGLAFKADTDDIRDSKAIKIVRELRGHGATVSVYDPQAMENSRRELGDKDITYAEDMYSAVKDVDAVCILTEWGEFKNIDIEKLWRAMGSSKRKFVFDGRNLLDQKKVEAQGFTYFAVGKRTNGYNEFLLEDEEKRGFVTTALLKSQNGKK
ncbi:UDP-glucose/GDP-mannose dehydrogenase family protein [Candidatus Nomurabacteria bacterium]|uniref:UDP-glucose 6-dehydrogenase n=1 Tax=candidate division WWE3 bacterium TaxID=2053526 RepID=A0A955IVU4_UNCKA|nr:UDP-glucose/GDP-mannose dehydrogenase family protein [candidate division WWE3 bacterium]MCB9824160.1 UDP-glucose/GDP-mannose dehydrogenase family protein [Candidatus Nomurabacteria bacterium]MCB9826869.1 UDP-glucose/GDP-mannose dehydrogenase family protein [Candidatus Nomurabacteria bacterium]MCB9828101.1 UDP-glucose/GDP-mannose dehydrogenase family protein [Candidatus Nomurabacteria bacterium]